MFLLLLSVGLESGVLCLTTDHFVTDNSTIVKDTQTVDADGSVAIGTVIISVLVSLVCVVVLAESPLILAQLLEAFNNIRYAKFWK